MKTIVLMVSKVFPWYHPRKGESTNFKEKILSGDKKHTLRGNYELWKKRIDQVNAGTHQLVLKSWVGRPYYTSQEVVATFDKDSGLGVQKIKMVDHRNFIFMEIYDPDGKPKIQNDCIDFPDCKHDWNLPNKLAANDGLSIVDFFNWFRKGKYDLSKPMAIIQFTGFRY